MRLEARTGLAPTPTVCSRNPSRGGPETAPARAMASVGEPDGPYSLKTRRKEMSRE